MIDPARVQVLNEEPPTDDGSYVLYWMQQSQRAHFNHALEHAIRLANRRDQGVIVGFGLMDDYPEANARHYAFMLQGLAEVQADLASRGIKLVARPGRPDEVALQLAGQASIVVCDRGYLRHQRAWRRRVASESKRQVIAVESDVVVPVAVASDKAESAARTLRPKLKRCMPEYLGGLSATEVARSSLPLPLKSEIDFRSPGRVLATLRVDTSVGPVSRFEGGTSRARALLARFLREQVAGYADARNDPSAPQCSNLSPYLHFGQISPVEVTRKARAARSGSDEDQAAFLEELIVRRELAANFVHYTDAYDEFASLPDWARKTLAQHRGDDRRHHYSRAQLEAADTHDPYWNAAMTEMLRTGYMHNYMRMYWGKKVLEWSQTPKRAFETLLYLNNRYFLDGRDPNSYANVAWIFGQHDRPWPERDIFGKVRYMSAGGLERKFDIQAYVEWARGLPRARCS